MAEKYVWFRKTASTSSTERGMFANSENVNRAYSSNAKYPRPGELYYYQDPAEFTIGAYSSNWTTLGGATVGDIAGRNDQYPNLIAVDTYGGGTVMAYKANRDVRLKGFDKQFGVTERYIGTDTLNWSNNGRLYILFGLTQGHTGGADTNNNYTYFDQRYRRCWGVARMTSDGTLYVQETTGQYADTIHTYGDGISSERVQDSARNLSIATQSLSPTKSRTPFGSGQDWPNDNKQVGILRERNYWS